MKLSNIFVILVIVAFAAIISCEGTNDPAFKGNLIPLEVGKVWVYDHAEYTNNGASGFETESEAKIFAKTENNTYLISNLFSHSEIGQLGIHYYNDDEGFYSAGPIGNLENLLFKYPAKRGDIYYNSEQTSMDIVISTDTLIVVAGKEYKCYGYESKAVDNPDSYAVTYVKPGLGIVQYSRYSISETDTILTMQRKLKEVKNESGN